MELQEKSSESVSGVFPELFRKFLRKVPAILGVWPNSPRNNFWPPRETWRKRSSKTGRLHESRVFGHLPCESVRPVQESKNSKMGKRGFRSQKTRRFKSNNPHFSGVRGYGFLTPKPSFPVFGDFDPYTGRTDSQHLPSSTQR